MTNIYAPTAQDTISPVELELYHLIMDYRAANGLAAIPLSDGLSITAGRHALDTHDNIWGAGLTLPDGANLHSWSDAPYYGDHSEPEVMWFAPQRLGTSYTDHSFEISAAGYGDIEGALAGWQGSPGHNQVILNLNGWANLDWNAIGVGVEIGDSSLPFGGRIYHVWFGADADPGGAPDIIGTSGADDMQGTSFGDILIGQGGNDTYTVNHVSDRAVEVAGGGTDHVNASVSYSLRDQNQFLETLTLTGSADINGTGNGLANTITGNAGDNTLNGAWGNDTLIGAGGEDTLIGGAGNDTYVISTANDSIIEDANSGFDRVNASVSFSLRDHSQNLETLTLTGTGNINGTGNGLANTLTGNAGANLLDGAWGNDTLIGGGGADTMAGGAGDDTYTVNNYGMRLVETAHNGTDHVNAAVSFALRDHSQHLETLTLTGSANSNGAGNGLNNTVTGNTGNNLLNGAWGNDTLIGGAGNDILLDDFGADVMIGGSGADTFYFRNVGEIGNNHTNHDVIADFQSGVDRIALSAIDALTTQAGNQAFTFIGTAAHTGEGATLRYANGAANTYVYGDIDGDGRGDFSLQLNGVHTLSQDDFLL